MFIRDPEILEALESKMSITELEEVLPRIESENLIVTVDRWSSTAQSDQTEAADIVKQKTVLRNWIQKVVFGDTTMEKRERVHSRLKTVKRR